MEKSTVYVSMRDDNNYDCSYAIITKAKNKNSKSAIVVLKDLECGIFDYEEFKSARDLKFLLLKQYDNSNYALKDFYKIVGKMCHKNIESKYFLNHKKEYNRIKFIDFQTEIMDFDDNDEKLFTRYNSFLKFIEEKRKNITLCTKTINNQEHGK